MSWCGEGRRKTFQHSTRLQELWPGWRQFYIEHVKCHGDHFDAWSLPSRLRFVSGLGPLSCSFQRLPSHLLAFHYPRHRHLIVWMLFARTVHQFCPNNTIVFPTAGGGWPSPYAYGILLIHSAKFKVCFHP